MKKSKRFSIFLLLDILIFSFFFPACDKQDQSNLNTGNESSTPSSSNQNGESSNNTNESPSSSSQEGETQEPTSIIYEYTNDELYTLAQAYEDGKITREHLLNIAYYQGSAEYNPNAYGESFTPIVKAEFTDKLSLQIRKALVTRHREEYSEYENATPNDFSVSEKSYYGCYNGYYAFFYKDISGMVAYPEWIYEYDEVIDGVTLHFNFPVEQTIYLFKAAPSISQESVPQEIKMRSFFAPQGAHGKSIIARSRNELDTFLQEMDAPTAYNDDYFVNKAVIAFEYAEPSLGSVSVIRSYSVCNTAIVLQIQELTASDDCASVSCYFLLEISKEEIKEVTTVKIMTGYTAAAYNRFYTLQEAYELGYITYKDLQTIAQIQPSGLETLSSDDIYYLKLLYYRRLSHEIRPDGNRLYPQAKPDDINNIAVYGKFNGVYCLRIWNPYSDYPDVVKTETVAGITFTYSGPKYQIWKPYVFTA